MVVLLRRRKFFETFGLDILYSSEKENSMYGADRTLREISVIKGEIERLKMKQTSLLTELHELQNNCVHGNVIESPRRFASYIEPLRHCIDCTLIESSYLGFQRFEGVFARQVSSDEFSANLSPEELQYWGT